jgi:hypothetical protein
VHNDTYENAKDRGFGMCFRSNLRAVLGYAINAEKTVGASVYLFQREVQLNPRTEKQLRAKPKKNV